MKKKYELKFLDDVSDIQEANAAAARMMASAPKAEVDPEKATARQELISWWKQDVLRRSTALVVGAGAIGNETLKNLALMGFGYIIVCDLDHVSNSNLSRTVLFTADDIGKQKAVIASERYKAMNVEPTAEADYFDGNICSDLGLGVFNHVDVVIGCLDNQHTRFEVNRRCNLLKIPYIDAGIGQLSWQVSLSHHPYSPCWACAQSAAATEEAVNFERHSCDVTKAKNAAAGHAPTVQVASSMVSALQVQEVIKFLTRRAWDEEHGADALVTPATPPAVQFGGAYRFDGISNTFVYTSYRHRDTCKDHYSYDEVIQTEISADWTLQQLFDYASQRFGGRYYLSRRSDCTYQKAGFVTTGYCNHCGKPISIFKNQHILTNDDLYCDECPHVKNQNSNAEEKITFYDDEAPEIMSLTLNEIGVPYMHIIELYDLDDPSRMLALELTGDMAKVMPALYKRDSDNA